MKLKPFINTIDFFEMVDRFWANHEENGVVTATVSPVFAEMGYPQTEQNIKICTDHFLREMRRAYPESILIVEI
jgi:hypothetical protein